jgi:hypothetical protein
VSLAPKKFGKGAILLVSKRLSMREHVLTFVPLSCAVAETVYGEKYTGLQESSNSSAI